MSILISVVVPALNEEKLLGDCLQSLTRQVCDFDYEVIVVADGSTDGTVAVAEEYGVKVIQQEKYGVSVARADGFARAEGEIIASTDADTIVPAHWLTRIRQVFADNPDAVGVGGQWEYLDGPISMCLLIKLVNRILPFVLRFAPWLWSFSGFNFAVKKEVYHACGGFNLDSRYCEDWELKRRLVKYGRVIADSQLMVKTSGMAFAGDPTCIHTVLNYLSTVVFRRPLLPILRRRKPC